MARVIATCMDIMDRPWQWGRADCCTAASDVFLRLHGIDPMAPLRGRYTSRIGALRLIALEGGWQAMARRLAERAGLEASPGGAGDIGLVRDGCDDLALGICLSPGVWAAKSQAGMTTVSEHLEAWSCHQS